MKESFAVIETINPSSVRHVLAADVGGTHARVGVVALVDGQPPRLHHHLSYDCAAHASLADILARYMVELAQQGAAVPSLDTCAIACAGYVLDDQVVNRNLPWAVPLELTRRRLGLRQLAVINDFEALGHALPGLSLSGSELLVAGAETQADQPMVVMGPGTGLGCAVVLPSADGPRVLATEAGQIGFSPGTPREAAIMRLLAEQHEYVAVEQLLSGPGLVNLYRMLSRLDGRHCALRTPAEVSEHGLLGDDPLAVETLQLFASVLGAFAADLAILYGASGGVFIAGGVVPRLLPFLREYQGLRQRFHQRGVMRPWLQQVPLRLIEHGQLGLLGAARWLAGRPPAR